MDIGDSNEDIGGFGEEKVQPRPLPDDLPKSLDDRRHVLAEYAPETEMYDAWQGMTSSMQEEPSPPTNMVRSITISNDSCAGQTTRIQKSFARQRRF